MLSLGLYFWFFGIFGFPVDPSKATICTSCTLCMLEFSNVFHLAAILSILWLRQETHFSEWEPPRKQGLWFSFKLINDIRNNWSRNEWELWIVKSCLLPRMSEFETWKSSRWSFKEGSKKCPLDSGRIRSRPGSYVTKVLASKRASPNLYSTRITSVS